MTRLFIVFSLMSSILLTGCGGISLLSKKELYRPQFTKKFEKIKVLWKTGKKDEARKLLSSLQDPTLLPTEKALKYNFFGVTAFGKRNYDKALEYFSVALPASQEDKTLHAQVSLNLASTYFKLSAYKRSLQHLKQVDRKLLGAPEKKKFDKLSHIVAGQLGDEVFALKSLIWLFSDKDNFEEIKSAPLSSKMFSYFEKLTDREKLRLLESYEEEKPLAVALLASKTTEMSYYSGKLSQVELLLEWMEDVYGNLPEIKTWVEEFTLRLENSNKINPMSIGVVLPLSGDKSVFGKRTLRGIDFALKKLFRDKGFPAPVLHIKDDQGNGVAGSHAVRQLVEKDYVSVIIGGLFSDEAENEFLEAKKRGAMFISLAPIYLPRSEKNHLLVEIPGSVESQLALLFSPAMLEQFGKKAAVVFPDTDRGWTYLNEFWRLADINSVQITGVQKFQEKTKDFRPTVKQLLGLRFQGEREEELELLTSINELKGSGYIRRIQQLGPVVDFDWVFIPAFAGQAIQLIPAFPYFDAFKLTYIGGPSWRSKTLMREASNVGKLVILGNKIEVGKEFKNSFVKTYGKVPKLVELVSYDAINLASQLVYSKNFPNRMAFGRYILEKGEVDGITGKWVLRDQRWLKQLQPMRLRSKRLEKIQLEQAIKQIDDKNKNQAQETVKTAPSTEEAVL